MSPLRDATPISRPAGGRQPLRRPPAAADPSGGPS